MSKAMFRVICRTGPSSLAWFKSESRDSYEEMSLDGLTRFAANYSGGVYTPVAWITAEEAERDCMSIGAAHSASIAAGRLIDCIHGKYIPCGAEDPELIALQTRPQHEPASVEEGGDEHIRLLKTCLKNAVEPKRPPLAYFSEAKRFDAFPGFITETGCVNGAGHRIGGVSPFRDLSLDGCEAFKAPKAL